MQESEFKDMPELQIHVGTSSDTIIVSDLDDCICVQTKQPQCNTEELVIDLFLLLDSDTDPNMPLLTDSSDETFFGKRDRFKITRMNRNQQRRLRFSRQ